METSRYRKRSSSMKILGVFSGLIVICAGCHRQLAVDEEITSRLAKQTPADYEAVLVEEDGHPDTYWITTDAKDVNQCFQAFRHIERSRDATLRMDKSGSIMLLPKKGVPDEYAVGAATNPRRIRSDFGPLIEACVYAVKSKTTISHSSLAKRYKMFR